ncbi:hypothetical protein BG011_009479 [Mortierella polycephala]|uniref:Phospholipid/glycerol acyltransferase domain-containing protein n=1 Tax=Mortierella polycephala TaxID=41804 RepID=A0A9P6QD44_9FUNG|nr:hypothetical protein BG011_009479 [Mortierella polycephala]
MLEVVTRPTMAFLYGSALFSFCSMLNVVQVCSLFLRPISRRLFFEVNARVAGSMWKVMQMIMEKRHKAAITFSGDKIPRNESALVFGNHRSFVDFYMFHSVAARRGMLNYMNYFAKDSLKYIPFYGWGMWIMGILFISRNWQQDQLKINKLFAQILDLQAPVWIASFLEGSRLTPSKLAASQKFMLGRGLPLLSNVLMPRTKGFIACVNKFRGSHVKCVYDFTFAYYHKTKGFGVPPNLVRVHTGQLSPEYKFHVHVKRYLIEDLPTDDEKLSEWVVQKYVEKDAFLEQMKESWTDGIEGGVWTEKW